MERLRTLRLPALFCALAVLACELVARPYVNMGVCDDWPYILMAQKLAATGHVVYNGWAAPMLIWQLYLAAALVKLFGFSPTTVRMSSLLVAVVLAFLLQRILVRTGISERNATIGTLAFVLSPLYLTLSPIFMTDIHGLFAVVLCLYGCIRALQASTSRAAIAWLCFAVATNAICGTSRQIAWLGVLVVVPSTLWLLRANRRVLLSGAAAVLAGCVFIAACLHWLKEQPYTIPEHLFPSSLPIGHTLAEFIHAFFETPFFLLPVIAIFFPEVRNSGRRTIAVLSAVALGYVVAVLVNGHTHPGALLEPFQADWIGIYGIFQKTCIQKKPPLFLHIGVRVILSALSLGGLLGLIASLVLTRRAALPPNPLTRISWAQLGVLLAPFTLAYILLLIPRASSTAIFDRYLLIPLAVTVPCLIRYYQERVHPQLPLTCILLVAAFAIYGVASTHNMFAFYRARVEMAAQLRAAGVPDTSVDHAWEYNLGTELQFAPSINFPTITVPAHFYVPTPAPADTFCRMVFYDYTPHVHPIYSISFDPNACYGPASFAPVHYSRWLASQPGTLYVVRSTRSAKP